MKKILFNLLSSILLASLFFTAADALEKKVEGQRKLIVNISIFEPMVMKNGHEGVQGYYGFDIDLWNAIAKELNLEFEYHEVPFNEIFIGLKNQTADVALAGITINSQREKYVDFSHSYFDSGLRILVRSEKETDIAGALSGILTKQNAKIAFYFFSFIFVMGQIFWWLEKKNGQVNDKYASGALDASYYAIVTSATVGYGDIVPKRKLSKLIAVILIFSGIAFFNYFQAQVTSSFTIEKMNVGITDHKQLKNKSVGTEAHTTSVDVLKSYGAKVVEYPDINEAFQDLLQKRNDAVVFDSPCLLYYEKGEGSGKVVTVGDLFDEQYYGIAMQEGSKLREPINQVLLKFKENGVYDKIYQKWFGNAQ